MRPFPARKRSRILSLPPCLAYELPSNPPSSSVKEDHIETGFIERLRSLKYTIRPDITDRATLEKNFREKFEALNRVHLTDADCQARQRPPTMRSHPAGLEHSEGQFARLLDEIVTPDVFTASKTLRSINSFTRDDGNDFIWHTTGSGKTLTSFKASMLLKENDHIHKCVFVVDRKDLDRQTREDWSSSDKTSSEGEARSARSANQFNKFQEGCVEENTNTAALVRRLLSEDYADKVLQPPMAA